MGWLDFFKNTLACYFATYKAIVKYYLYLGRLDGVFEPLLHCIEGVLIVIDQNLRPELPSQMMLLQDAFCNLQIQTEPLAHVHGAGFFKPLIPWKKGTGYKLYAN